MRLSILAFACGVGWLQAQGALPPPLLIALAALFGCVGLALTFSKYRWLAGIGIVVGWGLLGFSWAGWFAHSRMANHLSEAWEGKDVMVTGVVAALPQRFERGERFLFDVESVEPLDAVVPARVLLSWYHGWDEVDETDASSFPGAVRPGERWRFTVRLKRPHGNANPYAFDYEAWLLERNIRATGTIRARGVAENLGTTSWQPGYVLERVRDRVRERFISAMPDAPYVGVLTALAIGDQRSIPSTQWQLFNRSGITHLVSISGLHVTMVAALFAWLVNVAWRRSVRLMLWLPAQMAAVAGGWCAALAYALLAGFEIPAQRTVYMLSVVALTLWSGRHFGVGRTLLLALFVVLALDPWAVLATGFWLSFGAVAVLLFVGATQVGEARGWRPLVYRWGAAQWAVTIGSLPLLLLFFQQFSLVSPLANAVAIPLVSFAVTPLSLAFAVIPWSPLLHAAHALFAMLATFLEWLSMWPVWQQAAPPWWAIGMATIGIAWALLPKGFPARWLGLCLVSPALFLSPPRPPAGEAWVDVLDVGQGLSVLVRTTEHTLLYDTGPTYGPGADAGQRVVVPYLRAIGVRRLDALMVSHRDKDHAGGLAAVRETVGADRIVSSITNLGDRCIAGDEWDWDGVRFTVLHPTTGDFDDVRPASLRAGNGMSCVLKVASKGGSILLTADIEAEEERALIRRATVLLRTDVLLVPHHGGRGSSSPEFVEAVRPKDVIFSAGYRNAFNHPRPEVVQRYAAGRRWRTDLEGMVRVTLPASQGETAEVSAWRHARPHYWHGG